MENSEKLMELRAITEADDDDAVLLSFLRQAEDVILPVGVDGQVKEGVLSGLVLLMVFRPEAGDGQGFRIPVVLPGGQAVEGQVRIAGAVVPEAEFPGPEHRVLHPEGDEYNCTWNEANPFKKG